MLKLNQALLQYIMIMVINGVGFAKRKDFCARLTSMKNSAIKVVNISQQVEKCGKINAHDCYE